MTRINSAIKPTKLTDQHLIAELRELPRIFTAVNKRIENGWGFGDMPEKFTLGEGHMKFFYNKLKFLFYRHCELREEYCKRFEKDWQFKPCSLQKVDMLINKSLFSIYVSTDKELQLLIDRISMRITNSKQTPRYYGKSITKEEAIQLLNS